MSTALSIPSSISKIKEMLASGERAKASLAKIKEKGHEMTGSLIQTSEVCMAAFVMGGIHGRFGELAPGGFPVTAGVGVLFHLAGFAGLGGSNSHHLHNLGDGVLASWLTTLGTGIGANLRKKAGLSGDVPSGSSDRGGGFLNDAEMQRVAASV